MGGSSVGEAEPVSSDHATEWAECPACRRDLQSPVPPGRRERVATAVLQGMAASNRTFWDEHGPVPDGQAERAMRLADALIAQLDK